MRILLAVATVCGVSLFAPVHAHADWLLGGFLGAATTQSSTVTLNQPSRGTPVDLGGVEYEGESFRSPQYYGARVTWTRNRRTALGIEGEFIHAKVYAKSDGVVRMAGTVHGVPVDTSLPLASLVQRLSMSHGLNFILANVSVRRALAGFDGTSQPRLTAVFRAGAGPTLPHAESAIDHVEQQQYEAGGLGVQVGGGMELRLWGHLAAAAEYKFTWASPEIEVADGQARIPSRSHHIAFGLAYRF